MKKFQLAYMVRDLGDGSVAVKFCNSVEEAEKEEEEDLEDGGCSWGESSVSSETLVVLDGKICRETSEYKLGDTGVMRWVPVYIPLKEIV